MVHMSHNKKVYVWTVSAVVAFIIILAGLPKLFGGQDWAQNFEQWGYPRWFRIIVGLVEVAGAVLLVNQRTALFAAGALMIIMAGATYTQFFYGTAAEAIMPMILGLLLLTIVIARWPHPTEETGKLNEPIEEDSDDDEESPLVAR